MNTSGGFSHHTVLDGKRGVSKTQQGIEKELSPNGLYKWAAMCKKKSSIPKNTEFLNNNY